LVAQLCATAACGEENICGVVHCGGSLRCNFTLDSAQGGRDTFSTGSADASGAR
jgi:hypothetical protein